MFLQVLFSFMRTQKDEHGHPKLWKFKDVRILVVDEGSMVSVHLLHSVLNLLTHHAELQKLIILGKNILLCLESEFANSEG